MSIMDGPTKSPPPPEPDKTIENLLKTLNNNIMKMNSGITDINKSLKGQSTLLKNMFDNASGTKILEKLFSAIKGKKERGGDTTDWEKILEKQFGKNTSDTLDSIKAFVTGDFKKLLGNIDKMANTRSLEDSLFKKYGNNMENMSKALDVLSHDKEYNKARTKSNFNETWKGMTGGPGHLGLPALGVELQKKFPLLGLIPGLGLNPNASGSQAEKLDTERSIRHKGGNKTVAKAADKFFTKENKKRGPVLDSKKFNNKFGPRGTNREARKKARLIPEYKKRKPAQPKKPPIKTEFSSSDNYWKSSSSKSIYDLWKPSSPSTTPLSKKSRAVRTPKADDILPNPEIVDSPVSNLVNAERRERKSKKSRATTASKPSLGGDTLGTVRTPEADDILPNPEIVDSPVSNLVNAERRERKSKKSRATTASKPSLGGDTLGTVGNAGGGIANALGGNTKNSISEWPGKIKVTDSQVAKLPFYLSAPPLLLHSDLLSVLEAIKGGGKGGGKGLGMAEMAGASFLGGIIPPALLGLAALAKTIFTRLNPKGASRSAAKALEKALADRKAKLAAERTARALKERTARAAGKKGASAADKAAAKKAADKLAKASRERAASTAKVATKRAGVKATKKIVVDQEARVASRALKGASRFAKGIPFLGALISAGFTAAEIVDIQKDDSLSKAEKTSKTGGAVGAVAFSAIGASIGASIGLPLGIAGVIIGGLIGGLIGEAGGRAIGTALNKEENLPGTDQGKALTNAGIPTTSAGKNTLSRTAWISGNVAAISSIPDSTKKKISYDKYWWKDDKNNIFYADDSTKKNKSQYIPPTDDISGIPKLNNLGIKGIEKLLTSEPKKFHTGGILPKSEVPFRGLEGEVVLSPYESQGFKKDIMHLVDKATDSKPQNINNKLEAMMAQLVEIQQTLIDETKKGNDILKKATEKPAPPTTPAKPPMNALQKAIG